MTALRVAPKLEPGVQIRIGTKCLTERDVGVAGHFTPRTMTLLQTAHCHHTPGPGLHLLILEEGGKGRGLLGVLFTKQVCRAGRGSSLALKPSESIC